MSGTPPLGVPGFCANCEDYADRLVTTADRALCPSCASGVSTSRITYSDLRSYHCGCRLYELAPIGSLEEQAGVCTRCVRVVKQAHQSESDGPISLEDFTAQFSGDCGALNP
jgi:RNA polymerase subunit RPABC4/transcription elongation factor Spt4